MVQHSTVQAAHGLGGEPCMLSARRELAPTAFPGTANTGCEVFCGGIQSGGLDRVSDEGCLGG